eukprot:14392.XXX_277811_278955_1 [CDS] Oithona nana genome sequencing.
MFWIPLTITIFALYWLVIANIKNPQPINGIYSQPGPFYWLKYWSFCLLMSLQRLRKSKQKVNNIEDLEKPILFEADNLLGNDSVFFIGSCVKSGLTFIVSTERRPQNVTYALVYVVTPSSEVWRANWLPYAKVKRENDQSFSGGGISITPVEPMRVWTIDFQGTLQNIESHEERPAKIQMTWSSDQQVIKFDEVLPVSGTAKAFAREPWNRQFFEDLEKAHQNHYEQIGGCCGSIDIGEEKFELLNVQTFRDHSSGTRDWKLMHRYIFHIILLYDGTKILSMAICQPHTCTHLELGYLSTKSGLLTFMDECDLKLANHGEGGQPSKDYAFIMQAGEFNSQLVLN